MCGIAGFYGCGGEAHLRAMTTSLQHRGPDAEGLFIDGALHLGHRRLAILDLEDGKQPMIDPATGAVLVYNGEIYNHLELREELQQKGQHFVTSHSDTETVLRAFLTWGTDAFVRFNGMFALALYVPKERKLWLARDRFGEKPLFYVQNSHGFAFASEIIALQHWGSFDQSIDLGNLQRFFAWGYMPAGRTLYHGCHGLLPGSWLCFDLTCESISFGKYWEFTLSPDRSKNVRDERELIEELRALLVQAVKRRLLSDVPLGIFLSGGLDSSAVLAACTRSVASDTLSAFSIGFSEASFDESPKARTVASFLGTKHYVDILTQEKLLDTAPEILRHMSEPLADASLIPTEHLAAFTRRHVTVALSGDGGDELFAGYDPFLALQPASLYRACVPKALHRLLRHTLNYLPASDKNMSLDFKLKRVLRGLSYEKALQLPVWMGPLEPSEMSFFFENPLSAEELFEDALVLRESHPKANEFEHALYFFTRFYLSDDILVKVDRASMMVSLESRAVFLDSDLVDFCTRLPNEWKFRNGQRKYLLRKALEGWLPKSILAMPKKGFGIPLNRWLRSMQEPKAVFGLNAANIARAVDKHKSRRGDIRLFLWALHCVQHLDQGVAA